MQITLPLEFGGISYIFGPSTWVWSAVFCARPGRQVTTQILAAIFGGHRGVEGSRRWGRLWAVRLISMGKFLVPHDTLTSEHHRDNNRWKDPQRYELNRFIFFKFLLQGYYMNLTYTCYFNVTLNHQIYWILRGVDDYRLLIVKANFKSNKKMQMRYMLQD